MAQEQNQLTINRAKTIAAMGMVERDYEGFNVTNPGIRKEVFRVWRDEDGRVRCSCPEFEEKSQTEPRYRCEHILAVKFHLEPPDQQTEADNALMPQMAAPGLQAAVENTQPGSAAEDHRQLHAEIWEAVTDIWERIGDLNNAIKELERKLETAGIKHYPDGKFIFPRDPVAKSMNDLVTPKQLVAVRAIANAHGINAEAECLEQLKCRPEELSRKAASTFIDYLKSLQPDRG